MAKAPKTAAPAEAPEGPVVKSNDTLEIIDNTEASVEAARPVETEEYELTEGLLQVNYL